ncbi:hypothetical protein TorRG33x02_183150 [Trema orientale]|uniref:Uncharacterized protein n=1 Tax=Trema orientale TaxID=63057 RepID=A0A2P5EJY1_TREOI|nr:hypothetical protein TorRG33x02_183150 [Trema orientale]
MDGEHLGPLRGIKLNVAKSRDSISIIKYRYLVDVTHAHKLNKQQPGPGPGGLPTTFP